MSESSAQGQSKPTMLFAGGGSGGHIFPNLAVWERVQQMRKGVRGHFVVSERELDATICTQQSLAFTAIGAQPLSTKPTGMLRFIQGGKRGTKQTLKLIDELNVKAVLASGGFVSAPVVKAAKQRNIPVALMSLDAVPGKANKLMAGKADQLFTSLPYAKWPNAQAVGVPLREASLPQMPMDQCKRRMGWPVNQPVLLVTAGSQGLGSINRMMVEPEVMAAIAQAGWHVVHLSGKRDEAMVRAGYEQGGVSATVMAFCDRMGLAWGAAELAITLAGAGSVAEAWAHAVPSLMYVYPYHKDEHQKLNARPLVELGAAVLMTDHIEPHVNAKHLVPMLQNTMNKSLTRQNMRAAAQAKRPPDAAGVVAQWLVQQIR